MNYKVVIDAGHGGNDPGAVNGNIYEKDFNLEVSNYIYDRLSALGVPVAITRDIDETLSRNERINRILDAFGNDENVIVLSNHINSGGGEGAEVVYALRNDNTLAQSVLDKIGEKGQKKRTAYQRRLPEDPSKDYYFIHRLTGNTEPLLIEYGFIDNPNDLYKLQNNLLDYGEAVVNAVADYIGVEYIPTNGIQDEETEIYVVKPGDSLYSIANRFGITINELKAANNLTSNILSIGQQLIIPRKTTPEITLPENYNVYIVKKGDTLYSIATQYGISVNDLIEFNQLTTTGLTIGQQLLIPYQSSTEDVDTTLYVIQPKDTLWKLSQLCNISIEEIIELNNLETTILQPGNSLLLPAYCNLNNENQEQEENLLKHIVTVNDTLYSLARKYNTTVQKLIDYNNLNSNVLTIGQILLIPSTSEYINYYVQQKSNYSATRTMTLSTKFTNVFL